MDNIETRFTIGNLLVTFGLSYILSHFIPDVSFTLTFLGLFLLIEGIFYSVKKVLLKEKDLASYLSMLFIGISFVLFALHILQYSFLMLITSIIISIGLALLISGGIFKYSSKEIISGLTLLGIGIILLIPSFFHVSEKFYNYIRIFGFGGLFIILGIVIMLPKRGGKTE